MNTITWQLLAVLVIAAMLGFLIGLTSMRLHQVRREKQAYNLHKAAMQKLRTERDEQTDAALHAQAALEAEQSRSAAAAEKQSDLASQREALHVHAELQAQRLSKMTSELHAAEEKNIRLQRDFASFKANKLREVRMLKVSSDEWLDNEELPVLNKKVAQSDTTETDTGFAEIIESDADLTQPIIASELDIPSLAESMLPDSVEELEFELVDDNEPGNRG